jgi:hypothetical protein
MDKPLHPLNDDELLGKFFAEQRQDIADDGFSREVMSRLPRTVQRMEGIWTCFCVFLGLVAFFAFKGWQHILGWLSQAFESIAAFVQGISLSGVTLNSLVTILVAMTVLSVVTVISLDQNA